MTESQVLRRLDYPAYCIKLLDNGLVALAGGGGTAKTGVGNSIELGFLTYSNNTAEFKQIHQFNSEDAIMKFVSFTQERSNIKKKSKINDLYLAAAVDQTVEIYKILPHFKKDQKKYEPSAKIKLINKIHLEENVATIQVYTNTHKILLILGTSKGSILIYKLVNNEKNNNISDDMNKINFEKIHQFNEGHSNEIDELQVNSDGILLSIGKDSKCFLWSLNENLKKLCEFKYFNFLSVDNLRVKHARFSKDSKYMYLTYIPRIRGGKTPLNSYIQKWSKVNDASKQEGMNYALEKTVKIKNTILTCVQTSKDGCFLSAGDCEGKIYLFDYELNKLEDFKKQHSSVITDLCFCYDEEFDAKNLSKKFDLNKFILTISIDRTVQMYKFLNTNLTKRFMDRLNWKLNSNLVNICTLSISCLKFSLIFLVLCVTICYFFVHFEK
ncbi:unnamed protein product [Brachionus calyciflorus]|uniref:Prolactin regulatory element-binding protein n=1 Tax=Brachionus calyciflorus TaxID=104777 RepID=A0A813M1D0_9BILA|nr:unnamed protein product [Brachionus calyciflorus]